jgi:hypothetical protein
LRANELGQLLRSSPLGNRRRSAGDAEHDKTSKERAECQRRCEGGDREADHAADCQPFPQELTKDAHVFCVKVGAQDRSRTPPIGIVRSACLAVNNLLSRETGGHSQTLLNRS